MISRLRLVHLTVVGNDRPPASVEFGEHLTVIHGASDTGKSHVFDLIRYSFGLAKEIEVPVEGKGYQYVHLGLHVAGVGTVTLIRDLAGGSIGLFDGDVRELPTEPAPEYLKAQHISKDPRSVSRYLLACIGLDEQLVRKNQYNETRMLEWRDVIRLATVDEETILARRSPVEFGQHADRPVEAAIFRLFIEGDDDAGLTPIPKPADLKKISANKLELIDQVIARLEEELADSAPPDQLRDQLARLTNSLRETSTAIDDVSSRRDGLVLQRSANTSMLAELRERHDELTSLNSRFGLLRAQYDSDLSRLEMLAQATDLFTVDGEGSCPFCGAEPDHQHWPDAPTDPTEAATFASAITSEQSKIFALRTGLDQTIGAVQAERQEIRTRSRSLTDENTRHTSEIRQLDAEIKTPGGDLAQLLEVRSRVEREIDAHSRLADFYILRATTAQVEKPKTSTEVPIVTSDLNQFNEVARQILQQWSFPGSTVSYSISERDLMVDQRVRRVRGKGVRSILHALFNVALAEYCLRRDYRHPGFVVLDSPIVSYRQAGDPEPSGEDETISTNVVDAFYAYLQNDFQGQSLILENKSPVSPLPAGSSEYFFGGAAKDAERSGFYPEQRRGDG
ncbi:hypothetical protein XU06_31795 (plasmid) [Rhodococcus erythropolis]|nr:hypothetical protein XU06_31795 [Rhodococcus erythropolis]